MEPPEELTTESGEKTPCSQCGQLILPRTAASNSGRCARCAQPKYGRVVFSGVLGVALPLGGVALALDGPLSVSAVILGLFVAAAMSVLLLWLSLAPYREKYADDPRGKRTPTMRRDKELVSMLWWDIVSGYVVWVLLGLGSAFLLTQRMQVLTEYHGMLLQIFVLLTAPLIAVSIAGGTAHAQLRAAWVQPLEKTTWMIVRYGLGLFGLMVIHGTLRLSEGTWIEALWAKGGLFFEVIYVAAVAVAVWFSFSAIWRALKRAWLAHDEKQEAARKARRQAKAKKTAPKPKTATAAASQPHAAASATAPATYAAPEVDELGSLAISVTELEQAHEQTLLRLRDILATIDGPDSWSRLTTSWIDEMIAFLRNRDSPPPEWRHAAPLSVRHGNQKAEFEEETGNSAMRLMAAWAGVRLAEMSADASRTADDSPTRKAHRAMIGFISNVMRRCGANPAYSLHRYAEDLVQAAHGGPLDRGLNGEEPLVEPAAELPATPVEFDREKLRQAQAKWLEDVEYTPRDVTREFGKLVFEDVLNEKCIELIKAGANPNVKGPYVSTALIHACENGAADLVKVMLEHGAFPDQRGTYEHSALTNAIGEDHVDIAMMLIEAGANVNTTGNSRFTPLMAAASHGYDGLVRVLMERGADAEYRAPAQFRGMNAEEIAEHRGNLRTAELIRELKTKHRPAVRIQDGAGYPGREEAYYEELFEMQCAIVKVLD